MLRFPKKNQGNNKNERDNIRKENFKRKRAQENSVNDKRPKKKKRSYSYKSRIRSLERLLKKPNLTAEVITAKTEELEKLKNNFQLHKKQVANNKRVQKHEQKYAMNKFFDKRKLMRKMKQVNRKLGQCKPEERETLQSEKDQYLDDLEYIECFPKELKYISVIIARRKKDEGQLRAIQEIKSIIKEQKVEKEESSSDSEEIVQKRASIIEDEKVIENKSNDNQLDDSLLGVIDDPLLGIDNDALLGIAEDPLLGISNEDPLLVAAAVEDEKSNSNEEEEKPEKSLSRKEKKKLGIMKARQKKKKKKNI